MNAQSLLIADTGPAAWQELSPALTTWLPKHRIDYCSSHQEVLDRAADPSYDVVIAGVQFVELQDFFLLKSLKCLSVPLVITTVRTTVSLSRRALAYGAFGVVRLPVDFTLALQTVILATWVSDILRRITSYRSSLKYYRMRLDGCRPDAELEDLMARCNVVFETTHETCEKTIVRMERSMQQLVRTAVSMETESRLNAYVQLREFEATKAMQPWKIPAQ